MARMRHADTMFLGIIIPLGKVSSDAAFSCGISRPTGIFMTADTISVRLDLAIFRTQLFSHTCKPLLLCFGQCQCRC